MPRVSIHETAKNIGKIYTGYGRIICFKLLSSECWLTQVAFWFKSSDRSEGENRASVRAKANTLTLFFLRSRSHTHAVFLPHRQHLRRPCSAAL
jgi:hypothetical protein